MEFVQVFQPHLLIGIGCVCLLLAGFISAMRYHSIRKKRALFTIEICATILMFADGLSLIYEGDTSTAGFYIARIANAVVFFFVLIGIIALYRYVICLFMETGKFLMVPKQLRMGSLIPVVGIVFVAISQMTGCIYYFDEHNAYVRGPLYGLSFVAPVVALLVLFAFILKYREQIGKELFCGLALFCVGSVVAGVIQVFCYGYSLINLSNGIGALILFWLALNHQNRDLTRAAYTEITSGLPNTAGFMHEVNKMVQRKEDLSLYSGFYFDIVRMSNINNKYGKELGDKIIIEYIYRIKDTAEKDEIVGRLGGNFFVALIKKTNKERFLKLLQDVPIEIEFEGKKEVVHVAAVTGVYDIPTSKITGGELMNKISAANLHGKHEVHRPIVYMDQELEDAIQSRKIMEARTRSALAKREFEPYYQPKVSSDTNQMVGAEALVRWNTEGIIGIPAEFVSIMERNCSVCDLDFYMLDCVCQDIQSWIEKGIEPVTVSVNFSRKNLGNPSMADDIYNIVKQYNIPPCYIQIEITETVDEYPMANMIAVVAALQAYGMTVAIDDFGTGSSSINLLKELKFDVLKIDKLFISYENDKEKLLLQNIIKMANDIGIRVIAEGVESMELVAELNAMGCKEIQGFVYDMPLQKEDFEKKLITKQYV